MQEQPANLALGSMDRREQLGECARSSELPRRISGQGIALELDQFAVQDRERLEIGRRVELELRRAVLDRCRSKCEGSEDLIDGSIATSAPPAPEEHDACDQR